MPYSDDDIEKVREASDIVAIAGEHVVLKPSGTKFKACCPFHQEKTPSFQVDPSKNTWHCFGCGQGGDVFDFVMRIENLDFPEAVAYLANRAHLDIEPQTTPGTPTHPKGRRERLKACCEETARFYHLTLMRSRDAGAAAARSYLSSRGLGSAVCNRWDLGYAPGHGQLVAHLAHSGFSNDEMVDANVALKSDSGQVRDRFFERIMFPIHDKIGNTIAFGGRVIGKTPPNTGKYVNTAETPIFRKRENLYGIDRAKDRITSEACAIIVEGYTDVIAMHEAGFTNTVAALGTALTPQHMKTLRSQRPKRIVYLFDGDSAGQGAADKARAFIGETMMPEAGSDYVEFLVVVLPDDMDPMEFLTKRGPQAMAEQLAEGEPYLRFMIDRRMEAWDLDSPEQRASALAQAVALLAPIKTSIVAADYVNYIADKLGCDYAIVDRALLAAVPAKVPDIADVTAPATAGQGTTGGDTGVRPHRETPTERTERELLSLIAGHPQTCALLARDSDGLHWSTQTASGIAAVFCEEGSAACKPAELVSHAAEKVEGAAAYLSAGTIDLDDEERAADTVIALIANLKEDYLLRNIRLGNARLKNGSHLTPDEYDKLFANISGLQKELNELRASQKR